MQAVSYTCARQNLSSTMDKVCMDREPMLITRNGHPSVVLLSLDDYEALEEVIRISG